MADNKSTDLPDLPTRQYFPEVKDKTIESVEANVEPDYFGISIRFTDQTALTFTFEACIFAFPAHEDWTSGEGKILKEYLPLRSEISSD